MSARVTAIVWARYPQGAGELLVALALADQCTDAGEYIAIDLDALAKKTRQARDTVVAQLRRMAEQSLIEQMEGSNAFRFTANFMGGRAIAPAPAKDAKRAAVKGSRITAEWVLPDEWSQWALESFPAWTPAFVKQVADRFRDYWSDLPGQKGVKLDWLGTWRNWCRKEPAVPPVAASGTAGSVSGEWWNSAKMIEAKAAELGLPRIDGEIWHQWRDRIFRAAGDGPWTKLMQSSTSTQGFTGLADVLKNLPQQGVPRAAV